MIKRSKTLTLGFGLLATASLVMPAAFGQTMQPTQQGQEAPAQKSAPTVTIGGKVSAVSETSVTIVDSEKAEKTITIAPDTKITKSGKAATAADIKADDTVVVVAKAEGDALTAITIKVT